MGRRNRNRTIAGPVEGPPILADQPVVEPSNGNGKLQPLSHAGECQCCKALRLMKGVQNNTYIYAKRGVVRYCKCRVCGSTWKIAPRERL